MEERKDKQRLEGTKEVGFLLRTFRDMGIEEGTTVKRGKEEFSNENLKRNQKGWTW